MPSFVAAHLDRLPSSNPDELELCVLVRKPAKLESLVGKHEVLFQAMHDDVTATATQPAQATSVPVAENVNSATSVVFGPRTLADVAESDLEGFQLVKDKKRKVSPVQHPAPVQHPTRKMVGHRTTDSSTVKSVPRQLVAFVGRLHIDTTAEELTQYLTGVGILDAKCTKMSAKDGRTFKTAAFRVAVDSSMKEAFYNEENWPSGCELRDWVHCSN